MQERNRIKIVSVVLFVIVAAIMLVMRNIEDKTISKLVSMAIVILIVAIALIYFVSLVRAGDSMKEKLDERQLFIRGKAYQIAFFTLMMYNVLFSAIYVFEIELPVEPQFVLATGCFLALGVWAGYCILNDAYFGLNDNRRICMIVITVLGVFNLVIGSASLIRFKASTDEKSGPGYINLLCGVMCLALFVIFLIKEIRERKDGDR